MSKLGPISHFLSPLSCDVSVTLFIKCSLTNTLEKLRCCPGKANCIHCLRNAGFCGKLNKVIFPSQPKTHFFRDILHERVPCSAAGWSALINDALALPLVDACTGAFFLEKCQFKEFHHRLPFSKSHDRKSSPKLVHTRKWDFLAQKYSVIRPNCFWKLCPCLAWESNSLTV